MKTTVEVPDDVMRAVKVRAVQENRKLKDMVTALLRRGLADDDAVHVLGEPTRVRLPLIVGRSPASADDEMTPERVAEILLADDGPGRRGA